MKFLKSLSDPSIIAFVAGNPSPESFPVEELAARFRRKSIKDNPYLRSSTASQRGITRFALLLLSVVKRNLISGADFDSTIVVLRWYRVLSLRQSTATRVMPLFVRIRLYRSSVHCRSNGIEVVGVLLTGVITRRYA